VYQPIGSGFSHSLIMVENSLVNDENRLLTCLSALLRSPNLLCLDQLMGTGLKYKFQIVSTL
jgi:hypothetical protein